MISKDAFKIGFDKAVESVLDASLSPIKEDETFSDYGLDSLDIMNTLLAIEDELGINIGELEVKGTDTFLTLYKLYAEQANQGC